MKPGALIVGGTGFVGPHLADRLEGRYAVTITGRDRDIRDPDAVLDMVSRSSPEIVVNLAAITTVRESFERPKETYDIAFFGLFNLLNALKTCRFDGRLLHVSSSEVYGFPAADQLPLTEASPIRPMSPYSVAKAASELLCHQWSQERGFDILVARPFTHIGPGQSARFAVAKFAAQVADVMAGRREAAIEVGALRTTRDLTDVRDVVRAYDLILQSGRSGGTYNVCSGREVVMMNVLQELIRLSGKEIDVIEESTLIREAEQQRLCGSYSSLHEATGWTPEFSLTRTLSDILSSTIQAVDDGADDPSSPMRQEMLKCT